MSMRVTFQFKNSRITLNLDEAGTHYYGDAKDSKGSPGLINSIAFVGKGCWGKSPEDSADDYIVDSIYDVLAKKDIVVDEKERYRAERYQGKNGHWTITIDSYPNSYHISHSMHKGYSGFTPGESYGAFWGGGEYAPFKDKLLLTEAIHHFTIKYASDITFRDQEEQKTFYTYFPNQAWTKAQEEKAAPFNQTMRLLAEELKQDRNFYMDLCNFHNQSNTNSFKAFYNKIYKVHYKEAKSIKDPEKNFLDSWQLSQRAIDEIKKSKEFCSDENLIKTVERRQPEQKNFLIRASQELIKAKALPQTACFNYIITCAEEKIWAREIADIDSDQEPSMENLNYRLEKYQQLQQHFRLLMDNTSWSYILATTQEKKAREHLNHFNNIVSQKISAITDAIKAKKEEAKQILIEIARDPSISKAFLSAKTGRKMKDSVFIDAKGNSYDTKAIGPEDRIPNFALRSLIELHKNKKNLFNMDYSDIDDMICPINRTVLFDPIITNEGHTYERASSEQVAADPQTRHEITQRIPNIALKKFIQEYAERNPKKGLERFLMEEWDITTENVENYVQWVNELNLADKDKYINFARSIATINGLDLATPEKEKALEEAHIKAGLGPLTSAPAPEVKSVSSPPQARREQPLDQKSVRLPEVSRHSATLFASLVARDQAVESVSDRKDAKTDRVPSLSQQLGFDRLYREDMKKINRPLRKLAFMLKS